MKALKIIGIIILVLVALFFIIALFLPKSVSMKESIVINKQASLIFKQVNNFQNWPAWSPWLEADPEMVSTYEGPKLGVGAKTSWTSKTQGNGSMTITESLPYKRVSSSLEFAGQETGSTNYFAFEETPQGTTVTWGVEIPTLRYPVERYFGLLMPGMMKTYFIKGLENLKKITEAMPDPPKLELTLLPEQKVLSIADSCSWNDIDTKMGQMYGEIMSVMAKNKKVQLAGYPLALYHKWDEANQFTVFESACPVNMETSGVGRVVYKVFPAMNAVKGTHFGAYDKTMYLYIALDEFVSEFGLEMIGGPIEVYITDPMSEPDTAKWQTDVYFPVK